MFVPTILLSSHRSVVIKMPIKFEALPAPGGLTNTNVRDTMCGGDLGFI